MGRGVCKRDMWGDRCEYIHMGYVCVERDEGVCVCVYGVYVGGTRACTYGVCVLCVLSCVILPPSCPCIPAPQEPPDSLFSLGRSRLS